MRRHEMLCKLKKCKEGICKGELKRYAAHKGCSFRFWLMRYVVLEWISGYELNGISQYVFVALKCYLSLQACKELFPFSPTFLSRPIPSLP
jgi:hypothetical protein